MDLSQDQMHKYVLQALTDDKAPVAIYTERGNDATSLLSVADYILDNLRELSFFKEFSGRDKKAAVKNLLRCRCKVLGRQFSWTEERKKRFLHVNSTMLNSCKRAWDEALATAAALEERIKLGNHFLKDYEIDVTINAYPSFGEEDEFDNVLDFFADALRYSMSIGHSHYEMRNEIGSPLEVDKTINWNDEYFGDAFRDDYICYAIHCLLDTHIWSFEDIISINTIWADVKAVHQNYVDLEPHNNHTRYFKGF